MPSIGENAPRRLKMSASEMFWEVAEQRLKQFPGYRRVKTPWWKVAAFCTDVAGAVALAAGQPTAVAGGGRVFSEATGAWPGCGNVLK